MLVLENSMQAYFREALVNAMRSSNVTITEPAQIYVVHLLIEFSRSEKVFAGTNYGERVIMADLFERAIMADEIEALRIYRHLGDTSLYLLGFFKHSQTRTVSINYYKDIGAVAYSSASDLSRAHGVQSAALFQELAQRFSDMVTVLENIANYQSASEKSTT